MSHYILYGLAEKDAVTSNLLHCSIEQRIVFTQYIWAFGPIFNQSHIPFACPYNAFQNDLINVQAALTACARTRRSSTVGRLDWADERITPPSSLEFLRCRSSGFLRLCIWLFHCRSFCIRRRLC